MIKVCAQARTIAVALAISCGSITDGHAQSSSPRWIIHPSPTTEIIDAMRARYRAQRISFSAAGRSFDISRESDGDLRHLATTEQKKGLLASWQRKLLRMMLPDGYTDLDEDDFRDRLGTTREKFKESMIAAQPFATRAMVAEHMGAFYVVTNDDADCAGGGKDGAMAGVIFSYYPDEDAGTKYGNLTLVLFGVGKCGGSNNEANLAQIADELEHSFTATFH